MKSNERIIRISLGDDLRFDVGSHPVADVAEKGGDRSIRAVRQQFDSPVGQISHPPADRRMTTGNPGRGRSEPDALDVTP